MPPRNAELSTLSAAVPADAMVALLLAPFIPSLPFTLLYVLPADAIRCCTAERLCEHGIRELLHLHMRMRLC